MVGWKRQGRGRGGKENAFRTPREEGGDSPKVYETGHAVETGLKRQNKRLEPPLEGRRKAKLETSRLATFGS